MQDRAEFDTMVRQHLLRLGEFTNKSAASPPADGYGETCFVPTHSKCILVVDDDSNLLHWLRVHLEREGFTVVTARSGKEALQRLPEQSVDLAIIDVWMPEMDGYSVLEAIWNNPLFAHLPLVMMCSLANDRDAPPMATGRILEGGLVPRKSAFVAKPFHLSDIVAATYFLLS